MYKQLWNFIMMYGDYDSLLILLSPPPNNVVSMTAKSIELFLLYKRQKAGTPLLDPSTQEPGYDIFGTFLGNPLFVMGHGGLLTPTRYSIQHLQICTLPIPKKVSIMRLAKIALQFMKMTSTRGVFIILAARYHRGQMTQQMLLNIPIQKLKFKKRMPTMRRKEAHNSFLLIYASSEVHSCHLTQFSTCNSGLSSSFLAGCFFAMMSSMICQM